MAFKYPPCLGSECKLTHGEKWGQDGEPLDGHVRENIGDAWGQHGASGRVWKAEDHYKVPSITHTQHTHQLSVDLSLSGLRVTLCVLWGAMQTSRS